MDIVSPYPVALWEGDSKWEVTPSGKTSVCSLKRIILAYIAENLGDVCDIQSLDSNIVVERDLESVSSSETKQPRTKKVAAGLVKPNCEQDMSGISDSHNVSECDEPMEISFSTSNGVTRIYTTVNFLHPTNVFRMNEILKVQMDFLQNNETKRPRNRLVETELVEIKDAK